MFDFLHKKDRMIEGLEHRVKALQHQLGDVRGELQDSQKRENYLKGFFFKNMDAYLEDAYAPPRPVTESDDDAETGTILFQIRHPGDLVRKDDLQKELDNVEDSFSDKLMELIREKGLNEVEVYKKADIDRRHFSKIRSSSDYRPTKDTVILLCMSMELTYGETQDLLDSAGFILSRSNKKDILTGYFFKNGIYDVILYKETLYHYGFIKE